MSSMESLPTCQGTGGSGGGAADSSRLGSARQCQHLGILRLVYSSGLQKPQNAGIQNSKKKLYLLTIFAIFTDNFKIFADNLSYDDQNCRPQSQFATNQNSIFKQFGASASPVYKNGFIKTFKTNQNQFYCYLSSTTNNWNLYT